ncbi:hypothetical protein SAZ_17470 [Streptomyces noursei ZPM]|nr:hypothetical protein SAZ_17470 [Streptomyces noursei ZPM]EPY92895.1 hypothetical protein K530_50925 [Streptomyces noursei CCRC 11814]
MLRQVGVVGEEGGDGAGGGVVGQAGPLVGADHAERVELARVADEERPLEESGDAQQRVGTHLVSLVHDGVPPGLLDLGVGPLGGGGDHHVQRRQLGDLGGGADGGQLGQGRVERAGFAAVEAAHGQLGVLRGEAQDEVVDLGVGLRDDHQAAARRGQFAGGADDQGGLPGARRGVDDHAAPGAVQRVVEDRVGRPGRRRGGVGRRRHGQGRRGRHAGSPSGELAGVGRAARVTGSPRG